MDTATPCTTCHGLDRLAMGEEPFWRGCLRGEDGRALCRRCEGTGEEPTPETCDCAECATTTAALAA